MKRLLKMKNLLNQFGKFYVWQEENRSREDYRKIFTQISFHSREKLLPPKLNGYNEDLLFYLFYNLTNDVLQPMAAAILYDRDWRFHTERRIWISKIPGKLPFEKGPEFERGLYYIFDPATWKKTVQELFIEMDKLEGRPHVL